jgi:cytolysin-activating lysine-acyltransferase
MELRPTENRQPPPGVPRTVAEALGQITWLFTQSGAHRQLPIEALEWSVMPAIAVEQFRLFTFGPLPGLEGVHPETIVPGLTREALETMPLGVALWGQLSAAAEAKVEAGERLAADEWNSGDRLWLLELISPYANVENKLAEAMLLDLIGGPFAGRSFNLHRTDPATGERSRITVPAGG